MGPPQVAHDPALQADIELIGRRWSGALVWALLDGPRRFNHLLVGIPGISDRVLTERLRELEEHGLVERDVRPGPPVSVSYALRPRGMALRPVLEAVRAWRADADAGDAPVLEAAAWAR